MNRREPALWAGAVVAVLSLAWWFGHSRQSSENPTPKYPAPGSTVAPIPDASLQPSLPASSPGVPGSGASVADESLVEAILRSGIEEGDKGEALLALLPRLSPSGQVMAARHALNLLPDTRFPASLLHESTVGPAVQEVAFEDLAGRPDAVKLPLLARIVETPGHPLHEEARTLLLPYLGVDPGPAEGAWSKAVDAWLLSRPTVR